MPELERDDVQGLVLSGYARMHEARYVLLEVADPPGARRWLGRVADRVTTARAPGTAHCVQVALTSRGLTALGVGDGDLETFPPPFREGMTTPYRQRVLGDVGPSAPQRWAWGSPSGSGGADGGYRSSVPEDRLHALLLLYGRDADVMDELLGTETAQATERGALRVLHVVEPEPLPGQVANGKFGVEHFGFADGMSQPVIRGSGQDERLGGEEARRHVVAPGEFVLGYPNGYGKLTPVPRITPAGGAPVEIGRNGSYLVARQLAQDVLGFRRFLHRAASALDGDADPDAEERLAAKLVGRWRSGAPLVRSPHRDDTDLTTDNAFGYAAVDPHGERCPLGAHIRRANPRDAISPEPARALEITNLHRILRRGRVYGRGLPEHATEDDGVERGLFFLCVNASIERQFEFVQQTWLNNRKFAELYDDQDPIMGTPPEEGGVFTVQRSPYATRVHELPNFVTVRGGAYFFLPGVRALRALAALD
ncbi:Dyp-type peroxidase family [Geodermatophilus pulveris]|uniref:Dyp-type peroxidase family n=1 Tax=Geodermatophilus pulveris TaxID=1564159 RepID=A0A239C4D6_9ACTN|nr:Dyp-type peroxidase domain-containing protein [Geodermatophilus pulveris]SNS14548.1 Dyp-type peroxidase family [Geodermatophilus pulveris]